jgi:hypothetical protein
MSEPSATVFAPAVHQMLGTTLQSFEGRPSFLAMLKRQKALKQEVQTEMVQCVERSRIKNSGLVLQIHKLKGDSWHVRWRVRVGIKYTHRTWEELGPALQALPVQVQRHYAKLNSRINTLNSLSVIVQSSIRWCEVFLGQRQY